MLYKLIGIGVIIAITVACSGTGGADKITLPQGFDDKELLSKRSNLSQLLSPDELAAILHKKPIDIKRHRKNHDPDPSKHATVFSWLSGKTAAIGDTGEQIDTHHSISMGYVREMTLEEFEQRYGQGLATKLDINALTDSQDIDTDIALAQAAYLAAEAESIRYDPVNDIGVPAYWEIPRQAMHLHLGDISFTITVNTEENERKSQRMAVALANLLVNKVIKH